MIYENSKKINELFKSLNIFKFIFMDSCLDLFKQLFITLIACIIAINIG
jgi:hypothetical protein